ncbi:MAG: hypothetical protein FJX64_04745 [Alphaproteobacteria bacterium]|nr:hypothetical protein [Alphaproteobacteria bacterium]
MRSLVLLAALASLSACTSSSSGVPRFAMGVEVPCELSAEDLRLLRGRANAMEREEKAALNHTLALVDAAGMLGGNVREIREGLIERSNENLRLRIAIEADIACGYAAPRPQSLPPRPVPRPAPRTVVI